MSATAQRSALAVETQEDIVTKPGARKMLAVARIVIGFYFLWAFVDKLFGLGFTTASDRSVLSGGTPAQGYINNAIDDAQPLKGLYQSLFANGFGDFVFMLGLFAIGVAMLVGAGVRIAAVAGALLMLFMYLVALPWIGEHGTNPILDSHWMEAMLLLIPAFTLSGDTWGLGKWWANQEIVKKYKWLR